MLYEVGFYCITIEHRFPSRMPYLLSYPFASFMPLRFSVALKIFCSSFGRINIELSQIGAPSLEIHIDGNID